MQDNKQEKSLIKRNILIYLEYKGITQYEFYKKTGVTRGILAQNNGISEDNIAKFLAYYQDVSVEWLLTGIGKMLKNEPSSSLISHSGVFNGNNTISSMVNSKIEGGGINNSDSKKDEKKSQTEKENVKLKEENKHLKLQIELQNKIIEEKERFIQALINKG